MDHPRSKKRRKHLREQKQTILEWKLNLKKVECISHKLLHKPGTDVSVGLIDPNRPPMKMSDIERNREQSLGETTYEFSSTLVRPVQHLFFCRFLAGRGCSQSYLG